jgi:release factor glutamine methyltransferase
MTCAAAEKQLAQSLSEPYGRGEAASIARIVLEDAFRYFSAGSDRDLSAEESARFEVIHARLLGGEPVQYVLGEADFFGLKFKVTPAVLIPRQETEELVSEILKHLKSQDIEHPTLLDIGLGSGCIGLTLKKKWPVLELYGMEKSRTALAVAQENAEYILGHDLRGVHLFEGDILNKESWENLPDFDVVASNPPYIPTTEKHLVPPHVQAHEPSLALFVEAGDPLLFYRVIADFARKKLKPNGMLFFECNEFNATEVVRLLREKGFKDVALQQDLSGADRMVRGRL